MRFLKTSKKAYAVLKREGCKELIYKSARFIYRKIPSEYRLAFKRLYYEKKGFVAVGDPLRVYTVKSEEIKYVINEEDLDWRNSEFSIKSGMWDRKEIMALEENSVFEMFEKHFREGKSWEKTNRYENVCEKIENNENIGALDIEDQSIEDYKRYLKYMDELYQEILDSGYKRQQEVGSEKDFLKRDIHPALNEIQVFIGRDGKIICKSGIHRLCIAKIIGVDKVPVRTRVRHKEWQELRDEIEKTAYYDDLSNEARKKLEHPELQDIVPNKWKDK